MSTCVCGRGPHVSGIDMSWESYSMLGRLRETSQGGEGCEGRGRESGRQWGRVREGKLRQSHRDGEQGGSEGSPRPDLEF